MTCFVENLTLRVLISTVLPRLMSKPPQSRNRIYAIDSSLTGLWVTRLCAKLLGIRFERFDFRITEIRDESGLQIRLRLAFKDLAEVQADALQGSDFVTFGDRDNRFPRLPAFLAKHVVDLGPNRHTVWRALLLIQAVRWKQGTVPGGNDPPVLILEQRPWLLAIRRYAAGNGVKIETVEPVVSFASIVAHLLTPLNIVRMRLIRELVSPLRFFPGLVFRGQSPSTVYAATKFPKTRSRSSIGRPRLAVEFRGRMNLDRPEYYSDLFFWQNSNLRAKDILLTSKLPQDPIETSRREELQRHGISAVALHAGATKVPEVPVFVHYPSLKLCETDSLPKGLPTPESRWLRRHVDRYWIDRNYWTDLFLAEGVKAYLTWNRFDAFHFPLADALESVGGISAIYQRGFLRDPSPTITVDADIMFGYAPADAEVERRSGSTIPYHVAVGYFGDHRAPLLRQRAQQVRKQLRSHGADYILAYFDEGSAEDGRWNVDHEFMRANYVFLLEKVLCEPWFGLALKPKIPSTLARRLGPELALLERAISTGRCHLYDAGQPLFGSRPPVEAALASDLAVHERVSSGTAGMEAALAGIPTLLLDREGWKDCFLYQLGVGRVVFPDWQMLWEGLERHRQDGQSVPGFGDWTPVLEDIDPFRDGQAARRMGTYLQWLLKGFAEGKTRETVLADAAELYCSRWGSDKVHPVNCDVPLGLVHA